MITTRKFDAEDSEVIKDVSFYILCGECCSNNTYIDFEIHGRDCELYANAWMVCRDCGNEDHIFEL